MDIIAYSKAKDVEKRLDQALESGKNLNGWVEESQKLTGKIGEVDTRLTSSLAEKATKNDSAIMNYRNADHPLSILTYDGSDQPIHPSVIKFNAPWNGFKYWMAYTPFPNGAEYFENPCLAVSNDLLTWVTPVGLVNPFDSVLPADIGKYHNSDTHIVYRPDLGRIEVWWRRVNREPVSERVIYRVVSTDGITFSKPEIMITTSEDIATISLVVMWDNSNKKYQIWAWDEEAGVLRYYETPDGKNWSHIRNLPSASNTIHDNKPWRLWHFDIQKTDIGYEFTGSFRYGSYPTHVGHLFYASSEDNITYTQPKILLERGKVGNFDSNELYRPCLLKENGKYYLFYSANSTDGTWNTGLSISRVNNDIYSIVGAGSDYSGAPKRKIILTEGVNIGKHSEYKETFLKMVDPGRSEIKLELSTEGNNLANFTGTGGKLAAIGTTYIKMSGEKTNTSVPPGEGDIRINGYHQVYINKAWRDLIPVIAGGKATDDVVKNTIGMYYWNTNKRRPEYYSHSRWQDPFEECGHSATTSGRPTATNYQVGKMLFDTTLGKPIWLKTVNSGFYSINSRANNQAVTLGYKILLSGNVFEVTTAGTCASTPPTFDLTVGNTTTDGTAVWTNRGVPSVWVDATGATV